MPLGGIILYISQGIRESGPTALFPYGSDFSVEFRVKFPLASDQNSTVTQLSGALWTLSSSSLYTSVWYEKVNVSSTTGTVYVTSSMGRLSLPSLPIFDDRFYNLSFQRAADDGIDRLSIMRHEEGEQVFSASGSLAGHVLEKTYFRLELGSSVLSPSRGEFWGHELRLWSAQLSQLELEAHSKHFESYGREITANNSDLVAHWRLADDSSTDSSGSMILLDSTPSHFDGVGGGFPALGTPFQKFIESFAYIPSIDYGWNQQKIRTFSGSRIDPSEAFLDEPFVAVEFNMYDALNEDISHLLVSYDELTGMIGLPVNRYREDYEGLSQMRETYFKRLQGNLNFRVFVDMLDFFDSSFSSMMQRLLPARSSFLGDELVVESHMLERPKYQYQLRPVRESLIDIAGSITIVDREDDFD